MIKSCEKVHAIESARPREMKNKIKNIRMGEKKKRNGSLLWSSNGSSSWKRCPRPPTWLSNMIWIGIHTHTYRYIHEEVFLFFSWALSSHITGWRSRSLIDRGFWSEAMILKRPIEQYNHLGRGTLYHPNLITLKPLLGNTRDVCHSFLVFLSLHIYNTSTLYARSFYFQTWMNLY